MSAHNPIHTKVIVFVMMFVVAISDSLRGLLLPSFQATFDLDHSQLSLILSVSYLSVFLSCLGSGWILERIREQTAIRAGLLLLLLSVIGLSFTSNYAMLLVSIFIVTGLASFLNMTMNLLTPSLFLVYQSFALNMLHFAYGVGQSSTQSITGMLLADSWQWRSIVLVLAGIIALLLLFSFMVHVPKIKANTDEEANKRTHQLAEDKRGLFRDKRIYLFIAAVGIYCIVEHGVMNWFVMYNREHLQLPISSSTFYLSIFFGLLTLGRLIGGYVTEKMDSYRIVFWFVLASGVLFVAGVLGGGSTVLLISLSGFFFSIVYPTMLFLVRTCFKEQFIYATSIIVSGATLFDILYNLLMGPYLKHFGYRFVFLSMGLALFVVCGLVAYMKKVRAVEPHPSYKLHLDN
ncbi:MFS transporter [Paenibacillus marinisediminis]